MGTHPHCGEGQQNEQIEKSPVDSTGFSDLSTFPGQPFSSDCSKVKPRMHEHRQLNPTVLIFNSFFIFPFQVGDSDGLSKESSYKYPFQNPTLPWSVRVDDLVSRLTIDEVARQTTVRIEHSESETIKCFWQKHQEVCKCPIVAILFFSWFSDLALISHSVYLQNTGPRKVCNILMQFNSVVTANLGFVLEGPGLIDIRMVVVGGLNLQ